jgi:hypothetical protein
MLGIDGGEVRFEQLDFDGVDLDFGMLGSWGDKGAFPRLVFEDVRITRCRLELGLDVDHPRMVRFVDCVLDTVTVEIAEFDVSEPWLNLWNVELRGDTEIPAEFVRPSLAPRPSTPAPEA